MYIIVLHACDGFRYSVIMCHVEPRLTALVPGVTILRWRCQIMGRNYSLNFVVSILFSAVYFMLFFYF